MLTLFEVNGFKNFEHNYRLDLKNVREYKFNTECIQKKQIAKMMIYGKNSVGKSNFGLALFDIVSNLTSNHFPEDLYTHYLNANRKTNTVSFRYVFEFDSHSIDYEYEKNEDRVLLFEKVMLDNDLFFEYDYLKKEGDLDGIKKINPNLNLTFLKDESILKFVINNSLLEEQHPLYMMMDFVGHMLWFRNLDSNRYVGYKRNSKDFFSFMTEQKNLSGFQNLLKKAGVRDTVVVKSNEEGKPKLYFDMKEPLAFFENASSGTKALYTFYYWMCTAPGISLLFIDEFDAFYHHELAELIVNIIKESGSYQAILTTHNTNLISSRILRPDCYFILTNKTMTSLADATDRELREGHNLEKLYIAGEFDE